MALAQEKVTLLPAENFDAFQISLRDPKAKLDQVFTLEKGTLRASGQFPGFLISKRKFENYAVTIEYRWLTDSKDRNGGAFVNVLETRGKLAGMEIDLPGPNLGHPGRLWVFGQAEKGVTAYGKRYVQGEVPTKQGRSLERAQGEWNFMEVLYRDGRITIRLNGEVTVEAENPTPASGAIMVQSGKGAIEFRKLEVIDYGG
jgi:hypothetical protein